MRKLCLRQVSFEKQMTVFLPLLSVVLLLCGVLGVSRVRQTDAPSGEGERTAPVSGEPVTVAVRFCANEAVLVTALRIEPQNGRILLAAAPSAFVGDHAVTLDAAGVRSLLEYYGDGVPVTLKEAVSYTDESGLRAAFPAGRVRLFANQAAEILTVAAARGQTDIALSLLEGALKSYLSPHRPFADDFAALAAAADTDIRIYHFHRCVAVLTAMAQAGFSVQTVPYETYFGG